jgi:hypothetical protein
MRRVFAVCLLTAAPAVAQAGTLAQFNFDTLDNNASTGTLAASLGSGSLSLVGGPTTFFGFGTGSTDPAVGAQNSALGLGGFPAQGVGSGTVGLQGAVSTAGFEHVVLLFDQKNQPSSNKFYEVQVRTAAAGPFVPVATYGIAAADVWENAKTFNLSSLAPAVNNNADFAFRIVGVFDPNSNQYVASEAGYNGSIPTLFDMVTIQASVVPEPGAIIAVAVTALGVVALSRRRE